MSGFLFSSSPLGFFFLVTTLSVGRLSSRFHFQTQRSNARLAGCRVRLFYDLGTGFSRFENLSQSSRPDTGHRSWKKAFALLTGIRNREILVLLTARA